MSDEETIRSAAGAAVAAIELATERGRFRADDVDADPSLGEDAVKIVLDRLERDGWLKRENDAYRAGALVDAVGRSARQDETDPE